MISDERRKDSDNIRVAIERENKLYELCKHKDSPQNLILDEFQNFANLKMMRTIYLIIIEDANNNFTKEMIDHAKYQLNIVNQKIEESIGI